MNASSDDFEPLTIASYAEQALTTDQRSDGASLKFPLLGLFGETGSLLSAVKKKQRDRASYAGYAEAVVEELGDVLWYVTTVAARGGLRLEDILVPAAPARACDTPHLLSSLQPEIMRIRGEPTAAFEDTLLRLGGEVGVLLIDHGSGQLVDRNALADRLGTVARTLIQAATEAGVTLEAAAVKNLAKIFDRWPRVRIHPEALDADAEPDERLPRSLVVDIYEREVRGQSYVFQRCEGINIGDRLTDNAMEADDYRFHDAFHFAHMAVLTWSPVLRSLLRLKRKSEPRVDEAEDGARAILVEEGVTNWIFGQAARLDFFAGMKSGDLSLDLLKQVRQFVAGYEADRCPLWVWEEAILQGCTAFRYLRQHRRGRLTVDMKNRRLSIEALT